MKDIFTTLERKRKRVPGTMLHALRESVELPKGVLIDSALVEGRPQGNYRKADGRKLPRLEEAAFPTHYHFDSAPHRNIRLVDVARALDTETRKARPNPDALARLVDRVVSGLSHTVIAIQGRPEGNRIIGMLNRAFNRILERMPQNERVSRVVRDNRWIIAEGMDGAHELRD